MDRLTEKKPDGSYILAGGDPEEAVRRLGRFEDFACDLLARQESVAAALERERTPGGKPTAKFRQLFGDKVVNGNILAMLELYGIA